MRTLLDKLGVVNENWMRN